VKNPIARFALAAAAVIVGAPSAGPFTAVQASGTPEYAVTALPSLGGTPSRGNSINDVGWIAGYSSVPGNQARHATLWAGGAAFDLGTLGGPNSSVVWPVKNTTGVLAGITQTATPEPNGENWSCSAFLTPATATGFVCVGFVYEHGAMLPLPTLGGPNGFATGVNDREQIVGWAENTVHDPTCVAPQLLQFRAVVWRPGDRQVQELPLIAGDTSSAATAINNRGDIVGISGTCDQAVGRFTAAHAVLWSGGTITDIGNLGGDTWNTPMAINEHRDIAGFASLAGDDPDNPTLTAFRWTRRGGIENLHTLAGHLTSQATGINNRGDIVGTSCPAAGVCSAFLWRDGEMFDLNAHDGGYTYHLESAQDINDAGDIAGRAVNLATGQRWAFVATPTDRRR
jgi:probable HAF family extracellular repeat protein